MSSKCMIPLNRIFLDKTVRKGETRYNADGEKVELFKKKKRFLGLSYFLNTSEAVQSTLAIKIPHDKFLCSRSLVLVIEFLELGYTFQHSRSYSGQKVLFVDSRLGTP